MGLDDRLDLTAIGEAKGTSYGTRSINNGAYALFSQQYLETPVISGKESMALTPTACTIKKIPVLDDV